MPPASSRFKRVGFHYIAKTWFPLPSINDLRPKEPGKKQKKRRIDQEVRKMG
jgi:hypothetical protein